jgi:hypothetical protein
LSWHDFFLQIQLNLSVTVVTHHVKLKWVVATHLIKNPGGVVCKMPETEELVINTGPLLALIKDGENKIRRLRRLAQIIKRRRR